MQPYLELLARVLRDGRVKGSRAELLSTGEKPRTRSLFGPQVRYDLRAGFPLVTTKRVPFRQVVVELLWFLRGDTTLAYLHEHGVRIWDQWATAGGSLGPIYGQQWRRFESLGLQVDQVEEVVRGIRAVQADPTASESRRLLISAWNPCAARQTRAPLGCHTLAQFDVHEGQLACHLYQRSGDLFLGVPWNIASYALLTHLLAHITGLEAVELIHSFGDAHIYENHLDQVAEQLTRTPRPLPRLEIAPEVTSLNHLHPDQFRVIGYDPHPALPGEVAV